jgi:hypothetical protein
MATEAFYWLLGLVIFLGSLAAAAGIYEAFFKDTPYTQAEWRRKANEKFGQLIGQFGEGK